LRVECRAGGRRLRKQVSKVGRRRHCSQRRRAGSPDAPSRALTNRGVAPSGFQIWSGPGFLIWNNPSSRYGRCSRLCRDGSYWTLIVIDCR
jgi:hypothetical protein